MPGRLAALSLATAPLCPAESIRLRAACPSKQDSGANLLKINLPVGHLPVQNCHLRNQHVFTGDRISQDILHFQFLFSQTEDRNVGKRPR